MGGGPTTVYWRGIYTDPTTAAVLAEAARIVGDDIYLRPIQGSYTSSNANSSGTHDGGGVVDIGCSGLTSDQARRVETALRRVGCAAWWRPKTSYWSSHVHAVRQDCGDLSTSARTQVGDYRAGYNGIPIGGRTTKDTGTRAYVAVTWGAYVPEEDDMPLNDADKSAIRAIIREELTVELTPATRSVLGAGDKVSHRFAELMEPLSFRVGDARNVSRQVLAILSDPTALAAELAPLLPAGTAPSVEDLTAALRTVLGSVDDPPAPAA